MRRPAIGHDDDVHGDATLRCCGHEPAGGERFVVRMGRDHDELLDAIKVDLGDGLLG